MKTWTEPPPLAALAVLFTLPMAGCVNDGPDVAAAPDAEPGDPAIFAPDDWPLQIGDKVSNRRGRELNKEFPGLGNVGAINVVNGRTYGARWGHGAGFLPDEDPWIVERYGRLGSHRIYEGHFPEKVSDRYWQYERERLPKRFHGRIEYYEPQLKDSPFDPVADSIDLRRWLERRARMRAEGLLPTPAQMSPERLWTPK